MKNKTTVRLGVACLAAMLLVLLLSMCSGQAEVEKSEYIVSGGDTIWSIATEQCPDMLTEKAVYLIRAWNELENCLIYAGDVLVIPSGEGGENDVL